MLSGDLSGHCLDEQLQAALRAAPLQTSDGREHFIGVEHLLLAILAHENGEGPGHAFLHTLNVDTTALRHSIAEVTGKVAANSIPGMVSLRADCSSVLRLANGLRKQRGDPLTHAGHVTEALLCEGSSRAARAAGLHMDLEPDAISKLSPGLRRGLNITGLVMGLAWEIPETAEDQLGRILYLGEWDARKGPFSCRQPGLWDHLDCYLYRRGEMLRVLMAPSTLTTRLGRWLCMRSVRRKSAALAAPAGARRLSVARFFREWPRSLRDHAGGLNHSFFVSRKPAGRIRPMTDADLPFCRDLYALLEERRQVPPGFSDSLEKWLEAAGNLRLAIEFDGSLAGCGAIWLEEDPGPADAQEPKHYHGGLSFGLVHPRFQRYGLGSTLLAFRMAAIHRMGGSACRVEGTTCSVGYLERAGFRFWQTWHSPPAESLFSGAIVLTDEDVDVLESWLGPEHTVLLRTLNPPPVRSAEAM